MTEKKKRERHHGMPIGGPVTVRSLETGEVIRIDKAIPGGIKPQGWDDDEAEDALDWKTIGRGTSRQRSMQAEHYYNEGASSEDWK